MLVKKSSKGEERNLLGCFFSIFVFIVALGKGTLWHLQKFLPYIKYIILEFTWEERREICEKIN
jgi:hypothetical protein